MLRGTAIQNVSKFYKQEALRVLRAFDAWNSTLLVITCHNEDESFQRNCCLSSACQWIQIQRNDKCPLQVECGQIHQFSNIKCMSLYKVHQVFVNILQFRLVYPLPVTIQAPLGSESLRTNLTQKVLKVPKPAADFTFLT